MKLRLEAFQKISVLVATQTLTREDAQILLAGVNKLTSLGRPWVLVDLSRAIVEEGATQSIAQFLSRFVPRGNEKNQLVKVIWIGSVASICEFEDLGTALESLKFKEFKEVETKLELEIRQDHLKNLISAREQVTREMAARQKSISQLELEYVTLNRNLRAAQTHLINRLLDPVFSDLWSEPPLSPEHHDHLLKHLIPSEETSPPLPCSAPQDPKVQSASPLYQTTDVLAAISELRKKMIPLQEEVKAPYLDGKADRLVSLFIENQTIRQRIEEVRETWIHRLAQDAVPTENDYLARYQSLLIEKEKKQLADSAASPNKSPDSLPVVKPR